MNTNKLTNELIRDFCLTSLKSLFELDHLICIRALTENYHTLIRLQLCYLIQISTFGSYTCKLFDLSCLKSYLDFFYLYKIIYGLSFISSSNLVYSFFIFSTLISNFLLDVYNAQHKLCYVNKYKPDIIS